MLLLVALTALGCHARFKKHAPTLGEVRVQIVQAGGPYVILGKTYDDSVMGVAIDVVQTVNEINRTEELARRLDPAPMRDAMQHGLIETIAKGPPFALTASEEVGHLLQIEVRRYGLQVPYLGAPGRFTFRVKARIYKSDGKKVYKTSLTCDTGVGDPSALAIVTGTVNNVGQLDRMTDEELQAAFDDIAHYCGTFFATRMRRHAG